jgi:hypothetical protein
MDSDEERQARRAQASFPVAVIATLRATISEKKSFAFWRRSQAAGT